MSKQNYEDILFEEVKTLEEGKYTGTIEEINRDTEHYDYTKYKVNIENEDLDLILSFPTKITMTKDKTPSSQHAKFLVAMGIDLVKGNSFTKIIDDIVGSKISFLVQQKTSDAGTFSEIVKSSVKKL